jgi:hypothetical protein
LLTGILRQLGKVAPEDRPRLGQLANDVKQGVETRFEAKKELLTVTEPWVGQRGDRLQLARAVSAVWQTAPSYPGDGGNLFDF